MHSNPNCQPARIDRRFMPESAQIKAVIDCHQSRSNVFGRIRNHAVIHVIVESLIAEIDPPLSAQTLSRAEAMPAVRLRKSTGEQRRGSLTYLDEQWSPVVPCSDLKIQDKTRTDR